MAARFSAAERMEGLDLATPLTALGVAVLPGMLRQEGVRRLAEVIERRPAVDVRDRSHPASRRPVH
jgi:hypothetical protein